MRCGGDPPRGISRTAALWGGLPVGEKREQTDWVKERMNKWKGELIELLNWSNEWRYEWRNKCMNEWMNEWIGGWMDGSLSDMKHVILFDDSLLNVQSESGSAPFSLTRNLPRIRTVPIPGSGALPLYHFVSPTFIEAIFAHDGAMFLIAPLLPLAARICRCPSHSRYWQDKGK